MKTQINIYFKNGGNAGITVCDSSYDKVYKLLADKVSTNDGFLTITSEKLSLIVRKEEILCMDIREVADE